MMYLAAVLVLTMLGGLWRMLRGPTRADRLLPVQLFGSTATALLLVMAQDQQLPALRDVALVLAALGVVLPAALAEYLRKSRHG